MFYGWYGWTDDYIKIRARWYTVSIRTTRRLTEDGFRIPKRFGFARYDFDIDVRYWTLIPFNLIIAAWWWFKTEVRYNMARRLGKRLDHLLQTTFKKGYERGRRDGIAFEQELRLEAFLRGPSVPSNPSSEIRRNDA